jgi:hypothetical protein
LVETRCRCAERAEEGSQAGQVVYQKGFSRAIAILQLGPRNGVLDVRGNRSTVEAGGVFVLCALRPSLIGRNLYKVQLPLIKKKNDQHAIY